MVIVLVFLLKDHVLLDQVKKIVDILICTCSGKDCQELACLLRSDCHAKEIACEVVLCLKLESECCPAKEVITICFTS